MKRAMVLSWVLIGVVWAQTEVDLRTQSKNVDFSAAAATKPSKTGTTLPSVCSVGETFFRLDALPGANLYLCASTNSWTVLNGTGGAQDVFVTTATLSTVSIANPSGAAFGCNGNNTAIPAGTQTVVRLTGNATEILWIGISCADSHLKLIAPSNTFTCTSSFPGCDTVAGNAFTDGVIPLASVVLTQSGASFTFGAVTDLRAELQDDPPSAG